MLEMQGISKIYRTDLIETHALRDFSLHGRRRGVRGGDGALGLRQDDVPERRRPARHVRHGHLQAGRPGRQPALRRGALEVRNEKIGFIFQSFNLIPDLDVFDNVDVPLRYRGLATKDREQRIESALEVVGLSSRMRHLPSQLSGGQQQRVAIARVLAGDPRFLLADEPTGNLDSLMAREIMDLLEQINELGTTIVMVTHNPELARRAHRNIHIVDGQISDLQAVRAARRGARRSGRRLRRDGACRRPEGDCTCSATTSSSRSAT